MSESPIAILRRWQEAGGIWRTKLLDRHAAVVELCTCYGEPVDELRSTERPLVRYLAGRQRSDAT